MKIPPRKKWGQNFLIDPNIIRKIITVLNPEKNKHILEIGPGRGALTKELNNLGNEITAVEIDPMLCEYLKKMNMKNVTIYNHDILDFDCRIIQKKYIVIGNLPYNISTPILFKFMIESNWDKLVLMFQKEVAERMISKENNKKYGRVSIMMQSFFNIKLEFNIPNTVFRPMPDITSSLLSITPKKNVNIKYELLKIIVENAFKHRRKKLIHNLKHIIKKSKLEEIKDYRAEQLSVEEYQDLTYFIKK